MIYTFEEADLDLALLPMAARRALDCAGRHLSLASWSELSREQRMQLVRLGAAPQVDIHAVHACLQAFGETTRAQTPCADAAADAVPEVLRAALDDAHPISATQWAALSPLDRYVLLKLATRGRIERLSRAYAEILEALPAPGV